MEVGLNIFTYSLHPLCVPWNISIQQLSYFIDPDLQTKILVHGYSDNGTTPWIVTMAAELFKRKENMNILSLDWKAGASSLIYMQAVANARLVGSIGAHIVKKLIAVGVDPRQIHLIGHSLGAHVAGYIGSELRDAAYYIARISGLDPAGPAFEGTEPEVRIDPSDAIFVDVTHTNTQSILDLDFGISQRCGTVDFYPNGGEFQPGCGRTLLHNFFNVLIQGESFKESFACSHLRATDLYTESINADCTYKLYTCWSINDISNSSCNIITDPSCVRFGYYSVNNPVGGIIYFQTNEHSPFCNTLVPSCSRNRITVF